MASRPAWIVPFMAVSLPEKNHMELAFRFSLRAYPWTCVSLPVIARSHGLGAQARNIGSVEIDSSCPRSCEASFDKGAVAVLRDRPDRERVDLASSQEPFGYGEGFCRTR